MWLIQFPTVLFTLKVSGLPTPDLSWQLNGRPIRPDSSHKMLVRENGVHSLIIEPVTSRDAGIYTCIASNRAGENSFSLELIVAGSIFMLNFQTEHCQDSMKKRKREWCQMTCWGWRVRKGNLAVTEVWYIYKWAIHVMLWQKLTAM